MYYLTERDLFCLVQAVSQGNKKRNTIQNYWKLQGTFSFRKRIDWRYWSSFVSRAGPSVHCPPFTTDTSTSPAPGLTLEPFNNAGNRQLPKREFWRIMRRVTRNIYMSLCVRVPPPPQSGRFRVMAFALGSALTAGPAAPVTSAASCTGTSSGPAGRDGGHVTDLHRHRGGRPAPPQAAPERLFLPFPSHQAPAHSTPPRPQPPRPSPQPPAPQPPLNRRPTYVGHGWGPAAASAGLRDERAPGHPQRGLRPVRLPTPPRPHHHGTGRPHPPREGPRPPSH